MSCISRTGRSTSQLLASGKLVPVPTQARIA